jgi:hypothetical protein
MQKINLQVLWRALVGLVVLLLVIMQTCLKVKITQSVQLTKTQTNVNYRDCR